MHRLERSLSDIRFQPRVVLLFSGGRDSTIAAMRLQHLSPLLVTVSQPHLVDVAQVERRVGELRRVSSGRFVWILVRCDSDLLRGSSPGTSATCLACQANYFAIGSSIAARVSVRQVALGYTAYQSDWTEQSDESVALLRTHAESRGRELLLPVRDLDSKGAAIDELSRLGLSTEALEQHCLRSHLNREISLKQDAQSADEWLKLLNGAEEGRAGLFELQRVVASWIPEDLLRDG